MLINYANTNYETTFCSSKKSIIKYGGEVLLKLYGLMPSPSIDWIEFRVGKPRSRYTKEGYKNVKVKKE